MTCSSDLMLPATEPMSFHVGSEEGSHCRARPQPPWDWGTDREGRTGNEHLAMGPAPVRRVATHTSSVPAVGVCVPGELRGECGLLAKITEPGFEPPVS